MNHLKFRRPGPKVARVFADEEEEEEEEEGEDGFETVSKGGKANLKNLAAIQEARSQKNTDRTEQIRVLEKLLAVVATPYQRIRVLLALIAQRFNYHAS
ncbi:hypothetical protein PENSPDRAFT_687132 [Peniophora sp. CONT]|nr:hypothetical protein PENSPDRAFT_687132 [Peniophora sp. CONT]